MPHELFLTTAQETKIRDAFANNMPTDIQVRIAQLSKIIQSGGFLGALLGKLAGPLMKDGFPLAQFFLTPLATMTSLSAIDGAIHGKMRGKGVVRAGKGITLVISHKDMDDIIRILKSLWNN